MKYRIQLRIRNPNRPLFKGILSLDAFSPYAKNPTIRKFFSEFRWTDELGSGVKNVKKYLKIYANGAKPIFIEDDKFRVIVPLSCPVFGHKAEKIISFLGFDIENFPDKALSELKQLPLLQKLEEIEDTDLFLFQKGSGWVEKGSKLKNVRMHKINNIQFEDFQKGVSLAEKGRKLLSKRNITLLSVMAMCLCPLKVDDLLGVLKFNSRDRFRELYLVPLRKSSIVEQTIKDKPNSPDQKYILTTGNPLYLMFMIVYGVDTFLTILYRLTRHENIFAAHRSHLYQFLANESGISHVKVSTGYTIAQMLINLLIIVLAGQLSLAYQLVVSVGITGGLAALYIFVKGNRVTS